MAEVAELLRRYKKAKALREPWIKLVKKAFAYARPNWRLEYQEYGDYESYPTEDITSVYDGTAMKALDGFVSNLQSSLVPPVQEWIQLAGGFGMASEQKRQNDPILKKITETMFDCLSVSNFDTEMAKSFADFSAGVGTLKLDKGTKDDPFHFAAIPSCEMYLEEGPKGRVDSNFRRHMVAYENILATWDDAKLPADWQEKINSGAGQDKVALIESMRPCKMKKGIGDLEEEIDGYCYTVMAESGDIRLLEREQESSPWIIFRWPGMPGEVYPQGPLLKALPDIRSINKVKELLLKRASRDTFGLYTYLEDSVINVENIRFGEMSFIPVDSNGGARGPSIAALPSTGDLNVSQFLFKDMQTSINETLFSEPMGPVDAPVKTATEIASRLAALAKKIGSAFGQLQYELLKVLVARMLYILDELGLIDLGGFRVDGRVININYQTPLAKAQDEEDFMASERYAQTCVNTYGTEVGLAMAPPDKFAPYWAQKLHVPTELLPTVDEVAAMKQVAAQMAAKQMQANQPPPQTGAAEGGPDSGAPMAVAA